MLRPIFTRLPASTRSTWGGNALQPCRMIHQLRKPDFPTDKGLKPLFSKSALRLLMNYQKGLIDNVNRLTANTEYEDLSLASIARKAAKQPQQASVFNYASQAWNVDFFLSSLQGETKPMSMELQSTINEQYGSLEVFYEEFENHALAIFGSGWTWLVHSDTGGVRILNTYNAGSVLTPERMDNVDKNTASPDVFASQPSQPFYKRNHYINTNIGAIRQDGSATQYDMRYTPLLALNMWEHAYLTDYQLDRSKYIRNFLKCVHWDRVLQRVPQVARQI